MIGTRLKVLRIGKKLKQEQIGEMLQVTQSCINRYEMDKSQAPYKTLLWYADYFDVSMDYIYGRTDNPQGNYKKENSAFSAKEDMTKFIEACFENGSSLNAKFKDMLIKMALEENR